MARFGHRLAATYSGPIAEIHIPNELREARIARLATASATGAPHVVPFCFAVVTADGTDRIVTAVDQKPKTTTALRRLANIAENPQVSLVADHYADDWSQLWWVRVDGVADVVTDPSEREQYLDDLAAKYPQYVADRPAGPVVMIVPTAVRTWSASGSIS